MLAAPLAVVLSLIFTAKALPHDRHDEAVAHALPRRWYHPESHPVHRLFRRASSSAVPGSPGWTAQYPSTYLPPMPEAQTPPHWLAALSAAENAGKIPKIPVAVQNGGNPQYPNSSDPGGPTICSSTSHCRAEGDIWDAPDGHVGIGFDDGPTYGSAKLYQFLQSQNQSATHFMIGVNILTGHALFDEAFSTLNDDIAVHTWTHPYMTTQNNTQVVAQLGWTMQIIYDLTGGRLPRYWRPPYGDSDNRIRAVAREVFNLTQIDWNQDSADWTITSRKTTRPQVEAAINKWYTGPKSPGLIILEHELTDDTSTVFINTYPVLKYNGWIPVSVTDLFDGGWQNAPENDGAVQSMDIAGPMAPSSSTGASSTTTETTSATSPQGSGSVNNKNTKNSGAPHATPPRLLAFAALVGLAMIT